MPEVGSQLAGYRIEGMIGRGGLGVVYRATELALERPVALKLIAPELASDTTFRQRFLRESTIAASIDHAGILPVYAAGEADGELYLATRFVDGTDLHRLLEDGPLAPERALWLVDQIANALDAAHERGLVHGDVKPANVLVDRDDHCYLCDFGLTRRLGEGGTTASGLAGSLDYLAPEQIRRGDVEGAADQYALACVLYELLAGEPPSRRPSEAQTLWAHMQEEPATAPGYDALDPVLARALAKQPGERYASCNAFVDDARASLGLGPSPRALRIRRRRIGRRLLAAGGLLLGIAAAATALVLIIDTSDSLQAVPNSVAVLDPVTLELTAVAPVGNAPTEVAVSDDWVWVLNANDGTGTISRLDARTRQRVSTFSVGGSPRTIAAAFDSLWVGTSEGRVFRVDPSTDLVESSWTLPNAGASDAFAFDQGAGWLAVGPSAVWAGSSRAISRIDPVTGRLRPRTSPVWGPMAFGFGSLWVLGTKLERLSPVTMRREATVQLPGGFVRVATGLGSVWVSDDEGDAVLRVDPQEDAISRTYDVGGSPFGLAIGRAAVWVAIDSGTAAHIDPGTNAVTLTPVGGAPRGIGIGADAVWISVD
ncbi:MAG: protein kinase domain-containing protein [Gaiellaceae bacterium]